MNGALLIASRELRDRSRLFLIAAALSVTPFLAALTLRDHRQMGIAAVAGFLAVAYSCSLALALGTSTVGRELTERRLSFFFAKPISAPSIWIGKAAAGLLTTLGALAIIVLPTYLFARDGWTNMWIVGGAVVAGYTAILCVVLFFGGHALSTMIRSRSARVGLDLALLCVMAVVVFALLRPVLLGGGGDIAIDILRGLGAAFVLLLVFAPAWQLSKGRIDARQNHAALSTFLWSGMAILLILVAGFSFWIVSTPPSRITETFQFDQEPSGRWVYVAGRAHGRGSYAPSYLVDTATGDREHVPVLPWSRAHFSSDGRMIAWLETSEFFPNKGLYRLHTRRLEPGAKQTPTTLVTPMLWRVELSHDGSRIATTRGMRLEVYDVASGRLLAASQGVDSRYIKSMFFVGPDVVRIIEGSADERAPARFRELDIARRKLVTNGEHPIDLHYMGLNRTADGSRIYLRSDSTILDARTGALLLTLPVKPKRPYYAAMLADGSSMVTRDSKLYHIDPNGQIVAELPLPVPQAGVVGRVGASKILLSAFAREGKDRRMLIVDLVTRKVDVIVPGVMGPFPSTPVIPQFPDDATFAAIDASRRPLLWDARTGAKRRLPS